MITKKVLECLQISQLGDAGLMSCVSVKGWDYKIPTSTLNAMLVMCIRLQEGLSPALSELDIHPEATRTFWIVQGHLPQLTPCQVAEMILSQSRTVPSVSSGAKLGTLELTPQS